MNRNREKTEDGGFSLVETLITLLVLSIAAIGVMSVFATSIKGSANPLITDQAIQLAQSELDAVIGFREANGFSSLSVSTGQTCNIETAGILLSGFDCSLDICYVPQSNPEDTSRCTTSATAYKRVAATITHAAGTNISAVTLLANY